LEDWRVDEWKEEEEIGRRVKAGGGERWKSRMRGRREVEKSGGVEREGWRRRG
jgi:hypothetical protein